MAKKKTSSESFLQGYIPASQPLPPNPAYTPQLQYSQNYLEWALKNREQIFQYQSVAGGSVTLYTVPAGKTLFITSAYIMNANSSLAASTVVRIEIPQGRILSSFVPLAVAGVPTPHETVTIAFPFPIKVPGGTVITLVGNATASSLVVAGFVGFLEFLD